MSHTREEERRRRLNQLRSKLESDGDSSLIRVCGWGALVWGCRRETVRDYLAVLEDAELVEVFEKEDEVHWLGGVAESAQSG